MAGRRHALIIAGAEYDHEGLRDLVAPAADAMALEAVLADPAIGDFEVRTVRNEPSYVVATHVEDLFAESRRDDVLLLHFSCHGLKDESGELFFAARNTRPGRLASTAISADFVQRCMRASRSRRIVLLLDCCYGGAFSTGARTRSAGDVNVIDSFPAGRYSGRGRAVITAASAMEYAFEGERLADDHHERPSVFTSALVDGLTTGRADLDQDGWITLDELYDFVFDEVRARNPHQTPSRDIAMAGELYLARNPHGTSPEPSVRTETPVPPRFTGRSRASGAAHLVKRAGQLAGMAAALMVIGLFVPYRFGERLDETWPAPVVYVGLMAALATTAAVLAVARPTRRLIGPGVLIGVAAASLWGLIYFIADIASASGHGFRVGYWLELSGHVVLAVSGLLAVLALARTGDVHLFRRMLRGEGPWLAVGLGLAGALALAPFTVESWSWGVNSWYAVPATWLTVAAVAMPLCCALSAPRQAGVALLAGWVAGAAVITVNYLEFVDRMWRQEAWDIAAAPTVVFGVSLVGMVVAARLIARADAPR